MMLKVKEFLNKNEHNFVIDKKEIDFNTIAFMALNGNILNSDDFTMSDFADSFIITVMSRMNDDYPYILTIAYNDNEQQSSIVFSKENQKYLVDDLSEVLRCIEFVQKRYESDHLEASLEIINKWIKKLK